MDIRVKTNKKFGNILKQSAPVELINIINIKLTKAFLQVLQFWQMFRRPPTWSVI